MKLVVGLGNPGPKYRGTRHNIGFDVLALLAQRWNVGLPKSKFNAEVAEAIVGSEKIILLSPLTFMNLSGQSVRAAVDFFKLELVDLIIICDDLSLELGRLRIRPSGSAGGQNGLKDIIQRLGTQDFNRLRVGIGKPPPEWDASNYVLGKFSDEERTEIDQSIERSADAVECWSKEGLQTAMNRFNANPKAKTQKKQNKTNDDLSDDSPESLESEQVE